MLRAAPHVRTEGAGRFLTRARSARRRHLQSVADRTDEPAERGGLWQTVVVVCVVLVAALTTLLAELGEHSNRIL